MRNGLLGLGAILLVACGSSNEGRDGGITIMTGDTGTGSATDSGSTTGEPDAFTPGGGGDDAGILMGTCGRLSAPFEQLPETCLPRCTAATGEAWQTCISTYLDTRDGGAADTTGYQNCINTAFGMDTTPPVVVQADDIQTLPDGAMVIPALQVACGSGVQTSQCVGYQEQSCIASICTQAFAALVQCAEDGGGTQQAVQMCQAGATGMAVQTCINNNATPYGNCVAQRASLCFATGSGFERESFSGRFESLGRNFSVRDFAFSKLAR